MKGFILKDLYEIRDILKTYLLVCIILVVYGCVTGKGTLITIVPILILSTMVTGTFSIEDKVKWDKFAITTPVEIWKIILSKYILLFLILAISVVLGIGVSIPFVLMGKMRLVVTLQIAAFGCAITIMSSCILFCLKNVYGNVVSKMEVLLILAYAGSAAIIYGVYKGISKLNHLFHISYVLEAVIVLAIIVLLFLISFGISIKFYEKKDVA